MQQRRIQQKQITQRQVTQRQFTRPHEDHSHSMTLSIPQADQREWFIPAGTIVEEAPRKSRFGYLRSWIVSLLAVVLLPLGALFVLVGTAIADDLSRDWVSTTAQVSRVDDNRIIYTWTLPDGTQNDSFIARNWQTFVKPSPTGNLGINLSLCDVAAMVVVPKESGDEFTIWYDSADTSKAQCVPITQNAGAGFVFAGWVLVVLSMWILIRTFHRAARQSTK